MGHTAFQIQVLRRRSIEPGRCALSFNKEAKPGRVGVVRVGIGCQGREEGVGGAGRWQGRYKGCAQDFWRKMVVGDAPTEGSFVAEQS